VRYNNDSETKGRGKNEERKGIRGVGEREGVKKNKREKGGERARGKRERGKGKRMERGRDIGRRRNMRGVKAKGEG